MTATIESCRENLRRVAFSWRLGCDAQASEAFLGVVDELAALLEAGLPPDRAARLTALFPAIVAAQVVHARDACRRTRGPARVRP